MINPNLEERLVQVDEFPAQFSNREQEDYVLAVPLTYEHAISNSFANILNELGTDYRNGKLTNLVIGLDKADASNFAEISKYVQKEVPTATIMHNDSDMMREWRTDLLKEQMLDISPGKGLNVYGMFSFITENMPNKPIIIHDGDITPSTYTIDFIRKLHYPFIVDQDAVFSKANYIRIISDGEQNLLGGRVRRLFVIPFTENFEKEAIANVRKYKHRFPILEKAHKDVFNYIQYFGKFGYPLSGEMGFSSNFLSSASHGTTYDMETLLLYEAFKQIQEGNNRVYEVKLGEYDHHHQSDKSLEKMCQQIGTSFYHVIYDIFSESAKTHFDTDEEMFDHFSSVYDFNLQNDINKYISRSYGSVEKHNFDIAKQTDKDIFYRLEHDISIMQDFTPAVTKGFMQFKNDIRNDTTYHDLSLQPISAISSNLKQSMQQYGRLLGYK